MLQDFRTGYYTLASPKALFSVQIVGAFLGVLFSPAVFAFYNHAFKIGVDYLYSAPYAGIYRGMGIVAANGVGTLPRYCLLIACLMALGAVIMNLIRVRLSGVSAVVECNLLCHCYLYSALARPDRACV